MLPTVRNTAISAVTALGLALGAVAPAHALGKNEQKFLQGVAAALIVNAIVKEARRPAPQPRYIQPQYVQPQYVQPRYHEPQHEPRRRHHYDEGRSVSIYRTSAAVAFNSYSREERRLIQRRLAGYGYYRSGIDGSFGPGTYNAIAAYARDAGVGEKLTSREGAYGVYDGLIY